MGTKLTTQWVNRGRAAPEPETLRQMSSQAEKYPGLIRGHRPVSGASNAGGGAAAAPLLAATPWQPGLGEADVEVNTQLLNQMREKMGLPLLPPVRYGYGVQMGQAQQQQLYLQEARQPLQHRRLETRHEDLQRNMQGLAYTRPTTSWLAQVSEQRLNWQQEQTTREGEEAFFSEQKRQRLFEHQEALRIRHLHQQSKLRRQQQTEMAAQAQPLVSPLLRMAGPLGAEARDEDLWSPRASMDDSSGSAYAFQSAEEAKPISTAQAYGAATLPVTQTRLASSTPVTAANAAPTPVAKALKRHEVAADDPELLEYFRAVDAMQKNQSPTFETLKSFAKARKVMVESRVDRDLKVKVANDYKGGSGGNTSRWANELQFYQGKLIDDSMRLADARRKHPLPLRTAAR